MQVDRLIADVTDAAPESDRFRHLKLADMLSDAGHPISHKAVEKWQHRGRVPSWWLSRVLEVAADKGRHIDIAQYF